MLIKCKHTQENKPTQVKILHKQNQNKPLHSCVKPDVNVCVVGKQKQSISYSTECYTKLYGKHKRKTTTVKNFYHNIVK